MAGGGPGAALVGGPPRDRRRSADIGDRRHRGARRLAARICSRGEGFFDLVEVWVEGIFMLELLDPGQTAHYERVVTVDNLKKFLAEAA